MNAGTLEIVTIGDELLRGDVTDGNAAWLGRALGAAGIRVVRRATVGDDESAIRAAVSEALARTRVVLCTGGLGPTSDDRTKSAVASLYRRSLHRDERVLASIEQLFAGRGRVMPDINRTQADVPDGATVFPNPAGTAPGLALNEPGLGLTVLLPGVPSEVRALISDGGLLRFLRDHWPATLPALSGAVLRTTGVAESAVYERVRDLVPAVAPVSVAFLPGTAGVDVRLTLVADNAGDAATRLAAAAAAFRERLAGVVYAEEERDLAEIVGSLLHDRGWTIAVAESCTGGGLGARLTEVAGSSAWVDGGIVAYANSAKSRWLGVTPEVLARHGAVSEVVARSMVDGVCEASGAQCGISVTGIAGPGGGSTEKPVGTVWIGVRTPAGTNAEHYRFGGSRADVRERAAQAGLRQLQLALRATA